MYTVDLYRDGVFYAQRSLTCGAKAFKDACAQWKRNGYTIWIVSQPKTN